MTVTIRQLHPHFFGEVSGVDLRKPLTRQEAADIEAGMDKYAVLLFRDQDISDEQQMGFALNFGERENPRGGNIVKPQDSRLGTGLNDVSNLGKDGKPLPRDSRAHLFNLGNCLWHSDSSFRPIPAKFSLLSARVVNPKGGNTEFADMRAAYDALDDAAKGEIEDLVTEHSLMHSRGTPKTMQQLPPVENVMSDVISGLRESIAIAEQHGVMPESMAIDPGIGFGKTLDQNLELIAKLDELVQEFADLPIMIGTSRKAFIGKLLNDAAPDERLHGSIATVVAAALKGAHVVRVHDVKATVEAVRVVDAIRNAKTYAS